MLTCADNTIKIWENRHLDLPYTYDIPLRQINDICYSRDNETLICAGKVRTDYPLLSESFCSPKGTSRYTKYMESEKANIDRWRSFFKDPSYAHLKARDLYTTNLQNSDPSNENGDEQLIPEKKDINNGDIPNVLFTYDIYNGMRHQFDFLPDSGFDNIKKVCISGSGNKIAVGSSRGYIKLLNFPVLREVRDIKQHNFPIVSLAFTKDERTLVSADDHGRIVLTNEHESQPLQRMGSRIGVIHNFSMSNISNALAVAASKSLRVFDIETGEVTILYDIGAKHIVDFSPLQDNLLIIGTEYGDIQIYDRSQNKPVDQIHIDTPIFCSALRYDGFTYAVGVTGAVKIFDLRKTDSPGLHRETTPSIPPTRLVYQTADLSSRFRLNRPQTIVHHDYDYNNNSPTCGSKFTFLKSLEDVKRMTSPPKFELLTPKRVNRNDLSFEKIDAPPVPRSPVQPISEFLASNPSLSPKIKKAFKSPQSYTCSSYIESSMSPISPVMQSTYNNQSTGTGSIKDLPRNHDLYSMSVQKSADLSNKPPVNSDKEIPEPIINIINQVKRDTMHLVQRRSILDDEYYN